MGWNMHNWKQIYYLIYMDVEVQNKVIELNWKS